MSIELSRYLKKIVFIFAALFFVLSSLPAQANPSFVDAWFDEDSIIKAVKADRIENVKRLLIQDCEIEKEALILAVKKGDFKMVELLVSAGADVNAQDKAGNFPLLCAVEQSRLDIVALLLESGVDVNASNKKGETALFWAAKVDIANLLIRAGADVNVQDKEGNSPLLYVIGNSKLDIGAIVDIATFFIESGSDINVFNKKGETPLYLANQKRSESIYNALVQAGAKEEENVDDNRNTPLLLAVEKSDLQLVNYLISIKANLEAKNKNGKTSLLIACYNGNLPIIEALVRAGANLEVEGECREGTPLCEAVTSPYNNEAIVKYLIQAGANTEARKYSGETPLIIAARLGRTKILSILIESQANLEAKDNEGCTALMSAASQNNMQSAELLLKAGAAIDARDNLGITALMYAAFNKCVNMAKLLIQYGADSRLKTFNPVRITHHPWERNFRYGGDHFPAGSTALDFAKKYSPEIAKMLTDGV